MGQVLKRGNVWWIRYYVNGRREEESARTDKKTEAEKLLKQREGDVAKGLPISAKIGRLRFEDAAADLLNDYKINGKRSYENVKSSVVEGALEPWFRGRRMASITTADVRAYVADRQAKAYANATINRELAALKRMFTLAVQAGKLLQRPYIPMLIERNARKGFFERDQFDAVRNRLPPMYQALVTLAYYTGWRVNSEILTLEWRQVDRQAGIIRLEPETTKNRDGRVFKYAGLTEVTAAIDGLWARHEALTKAGVLTPLVFCRLKGQRVRTFWKRWKSACEAAGCPGRIPHDFRRTAVRNLNRAGVPETVAMKITGHKTRSVFDRYDITSEEDLAEASRRLQALAGTFSGTATDLSGDTLRERLSKSVRRKGLVVARPGIEPGTLRFSIQPSKRRKA